MGERENLSICSRGTLNVIFARICQPLSVDKDCCCCIISRCWNSGISSVEKWHLFLVYEASYGMWACHSSCRNKQSCVGGQLSSLLNTHFRILHYGGTLSLLTSLPPSLSPSLPPYLPPSLPLSLLPSFPPSLLPSFLSWSVCCVVCLHVVSRQLGIWLFNSRARGCPIHVTGQVIGSQVL